MRREERLAILHAAAQEPETMLQAVAMAALRGVGACAHLSCAALGLCAISRAAGARVGGRQAGVCGRGLARLVDDSDCDPTGGVRRAVGLSGAAARPWSIALGDQPDALWSFLCAGDLDLLASRGEVAGGVLKALGVGIEQSARDPVCGPNRRVHNNPRKIIRGDFIDKTMTQDLSRRGAPSPPVDIANVFAPMSPRQTVTARRH